MYISNRSARTLTAKVLIWSLILGPLGISNTGLALAASNKENVTKTRTAGAQTKSLGSPGATGEQTNTQAGARKTGQLIVNGSVTVNGNRAINGTTIFSDSYIEVASTNGNSAIANLGNLGRVELDQGAKLRLQYSEGLISGKLERGKASVNAPKGVQVAITEPTLDIATNSSERSLEVLDMNNNVVTQVDDATAQQPRAPAQGSASGAGGAGSQLIGRLADVNGSVAVNGSRATTGTTLSNGCYIVVASGAGNSAVADLGQLGNVELPAGTKIKLQFSDGLISGHLDEGSAVAKVPNNVQVAIDTQNRALPQGASPRSVHVVTTGAQGSPTPAIAHGGGAPITGHMIVNGSVTVDGNRASNGMEIHSGSVITVDHGAGNNAIVDLGSSGQVELDSGAKMKLDFSEGSISGSLDEGRAIAIIPDGTEVAIDEPNNNLPPGSPGRSVQVVSMNNSTIAGQTGQCCVPVPVSVPVPVAAPAPAPVPVIGPIPGGGIGPLGIAGLAAGVAGLAVGSAALANTGNNTTPTPPVVSPVIP